jgi:predicted dehydrogenase
MGERVDRIRWGIMGTGWIADRFATDLALLPDAELQAVGSRSAATAERFGRRFDIPHRYATYEALVGDPKVDVVYIATPNPMHHQNCLLCLEAGKHVLCEKPFALNAAEAEEMVGAARDRHLFLMEAMWSRFLPVMGRVRELVAEGAIGDVQVLAAELCIRFDFDPSDRRYAPELGGGALLDLGVYPIAFASMIMGQPSSITASASLGATAVDEQTGIALGYDGGQLSSLYCSIRVDSPVEAALMGTRGSIRIHPWWIRPAALTLSRKGQDDTVIKLPYHGEGYHFEAAEVMDCLRSGRIESALMSLDETLSIVRTLDTIRAQIGLRYPMEALGPDI